MSWARAGRQHRPTGPRWRVDVRQLGCTAVHGAFLRARLISSILPTAIYACAVCGGAEDNGYFWSVLFLMSMPFAIGSFVGGWLLYTYRRGPSGPTTSTPTPAAEGHMPRPASASSVADRHEDGP